MNTYDRGLQNIKTLLSDIELECINTTISLLKDYCTSSAIDFMKILELIQNLNGEITQITG